MSYAAGNLIILVTSASIQEEVFEVMARPRFGQNRAAVEAALRDVWAASTVVPLGDDDPKMRRFINDEDDVPILRTASGIFSTELASVSPRFLVTTNQKHFPTGTKPTLSAVA